MLGMEDNLIAVAWIATILSMVGCVVFGAVMWNKGGNDSE